MNRIALVVGHDLQGKKRGAKNYKGVYESEYNYDVALAVQSNLQKAGLVCHIFFSDNQTRKERGEAVKQFNPNLVIELHFNAFIKPAFGCEVLALEDDGLSVSFAKKLAATISENMKIGLRHGSGVLKIKRLGRGYSNLKYAKSDSHAYPVVIVEPCFANFKTRESEKFFEDPSDYIRCLTLAIKNYFIHYSRAPQIDDSRVAKSPKHILDAITLTTKRVLSGKAKY